MVEFPSSKNHLPDPKGAPVKSLLLVGEGLADHPLEALGGKTPLASAHTPAMDALARRGLSGFLQPIPKGYPATADVALLTLLGYDLRESNVGPATWRASFARHRLRDGELAFLCTFVTLSDGSMVDATAGGLVESEMTELVRSLNEGLGTEDIRFERGVADTNLLITRGDTAATLSAYPTRCTGPGDIQGSAFGPFMPSGEQAGILCELMESAGELLSNHPVNTARRNVGVDVANGLWIWGPSRAGHLERFESLYGRRGVLVGHLPTVQSAGAFVGLEVVDPGHGGDRLSFNYEARVDAAMRALARSDYVVLYVEAPTLQDYEDPIEQKIRTIETMDQRVVAPVVAQAQDQRGLRVALTSDRVVSVLTGASASDPVPFALFGPGVAAMGRGGYSEADAAIGGVSYTRGSGLTQHLVNPDPMGFMSDR